LETDEVRDQHAQRRNKKELRALADKISAYGRNVHQRYPTGDVVICERDLADQLRKRPDSVATALDLLLGEQKVQRALWSAKTPSALQDDGNAESNFLCFLLG